jgi:L-alanine-DL-glutamate epimerase-like enolase superfamily enzyme
VPASLWAALAPRLGREPFAQCALDVAAHDLWAKLQGKPLHAVLGVDPSAAPVSAYTVFLDQPERMAADVRAYAAWPIIKIKVGVPGDVDNVRLIREHTRAAIRVDANTGWTAPVAAAKSRELEDLGVTSIEQPLGADDWAGMERLSRETMLPLVADESCRTFADLERCAQVFDAVNIKMMKAGGITPTLAMIAEARRLGLGVMVGCMPESTVGISAIAHVAPLLDFVDADGSELLAEDVAAGIRLARGRFQYNGEPGLGFALDDARFFKTAPRS